jgi:hypothetical protein
LEAIMNIEGEIVQVMESWPLQLVIRTQSGTQHVVLSPDATINTKAPSVGSDMLKPGIRVQVEGVASGSGSMTAKAVRIENRD